MFSFFLFDEFFITSFVLKYNTEVEINDLPNEIMNAEIMNSEIEIMNTWVMKLPYFRCFS